MTAVRVEGASKKFGSSPALEGVNFSANWGTIQAVVGENGAGKTTLMRILHGEITADSGEVFIDGGRGQVGMVSQHYAIIPELSCLENLMLGAEPAPIINHERARKRADELAAQMGFAFEWDEPAERLSPAGAQKLEILKLLWRRARIMILDEPTAMLSPQDSDLLYASLRQLAVEGVCVIVVTHRLPEVMAHCSQVTVLRNGRLVAVSDTRESSLEILAEQIVGRAMPSPAPRASAQRLAPVLQAKNVEILGYRGDAAVQDASLELRAGEVVGIAGVDGSGQRELFRAILGTTTVHAGTLTVVDGARGVAERLASGLRVIPEDRLNEGLIPDWSLEENAALGVQRKLAAGPWIDGPARRTFAEAAAALFQVKYHSLQQSAGSLSGGNQQRLVAGRALSAGCSLLLAFQPARGLDLAGVASVYEEIRRTCREGHAGALVVSFDLDELLQHCDRILVMSRGRLTAPPPGMEMDRAVIGRLMVEAA